MDNCKICEVVDEVETSLPCPYCYEGVMYFKVYNLLPLALKEVRYDKRQCLKTGKMWWEPGEEIETSLIN